MAQRLLISPPSITIFTILGMFFAFFGLKEFDCAIGSIALMLVAHFAYCDLCGNA